MMQDLEPFYSHDDEVPAQDDEQDEPKILHGRLQRSKDGRGWQLNGVDLNQYLAHYHGQALTLVITSIDAAPPATAPLHACKACGFPLDEWGDCLRCQWYGVVKARQRREELFQEIDRIVESSWAGLHD